jgi:hypothetical protein
MVERERHAGPNWLLPMRKSVRRESKGSVAHHPITPVCSIAGIPQIHDEATQAVLFRRAQQPANWLPTACPVAVEFLPIQRFNDARRLAVNLLRRLIIVIMAQV